MNILFIIDDKYHLYLSKHDSEYEMIVIGTLETLKDIGVFKNLEIIDVNEEELMNYDAKRIYI